MTMHKSQGSQADEVTVLLPAEDSRLLTRELFYTAVTRAQQQVRVVGTEAAVPRSPSALRASGLRSDSVARRGCPARGTAEATRDTRDVIAASPLGLGASMPFLLRVELPDVPGRWAGVASAIGEAGGDIEAIEIVENATTASPSTTCCSRWRRGAMPDSVVSACNALDGVRRAVDQPVRRRRQPLPRPRGRRGADRGTARRHWTAWSTCCRSPSASTGPRGSGARPTGRRGRAGHRRRADGVRLVRAVRPRGRCRRSTTLTLFCGAPVDEDEIVVLGRPGGPEFLDSELARLGHLLALAVSISRS